MTATAILRLIRKPGRRPAAASCSTAATCSHLSEDELQQIRGAKIAMISQTPRTSLNPLITVGAQVARLFRLHAGLSPADSRKRALEMLTLVGIPEPERRARQYAHQFSRRHVPAGDDRHGAHHLAAPADRRRADHRLDVSTAARILDLLRELGARTGASILLITHDLGVVATTCQRVAVMHAGQVVEVAPVRSLFRHPRHPYTRGWCARSRASTARSPWSRCAGSVPSLLNPPRRLPLCRRCPQGGGSLPAANRR